MATSTPRLMMHPPRALTPERVNQVVAWLRSGQSEDPDMRRDYERLMEVYCVVKTGGVQVQQQAARDFQRREQARIEAEIAAAPAAPEVGALRQEMVDLKDYIDWRVEFLASITPAEETAVAAVLAVIEGGPSDRP